MRALANAIQRAHKDYKNQTWLQYNIYFICSMLQLSELGFLITEHSVLMVSVHELAVGTPQNVCKHGLRFYKEMYGKRVKRCIYSQS